MLEKPAFWILLMLLAVVAVVVLVIVLAVKGGRSARTPVATSAGTPGWYPQPDGTQRYWDGRSWTDHTGEQP